MGQEVAHGVGADSAEKLGIQRDEQQSFAAVRLCRYLATVRADRQRYSRKHQAGAVGAGLIACHDKDAVVEGTGRKMPQPGSALFLGGSPRGGMRHEDDIGAFQRHARREFGKMRIVAKLNAEADSAGVEQRGAIPGGEGGFFRRGDVEFAVNAVPSIGRYDRVAGINGALLALLRHAG